MHDPAAPILALASQYKVIIMSSIIPMESKATVILSAELDYRDACSNALDMIQLRDRLARQFAIDELDSVQACLGSYKGVPEKSIAITGEPGAVRAIARRECEYFKQESYLLIHPCGTGSLRFTGSDDRMVIGRYKAIRQVDDTEAWSRVVATGELFTFA